MDLSGKRIWQVAAGDTNRNYARICLEWDVILMGPGSVGKWPDCCNELVVDKIVTPRKYTNMKVFIEDIKDGDFIILRMGTNAIYGFGFIIGGYEWNEEFGDIDGWDLQHIRRVKWLWKAKNKPKYFDNYTLKLGDTVQLMDSSNVEKWLNKLRISSYQQHKVLENIQTKSDNVEWHEVTDYLFDHGVSSNTLIILTREIKELITISKWYQRTKKQPSEHETVAYLVIPLLRALGWTPQRMAVEWNNIDIALFKQLPRENKMLSIVVEAKPKDRSCLTAQSQAKNYAESPERNGCEKLIVTDGIRYGIYIKNSGKFTDIPYAYLNLTRMRKDYPILKCKGAKDAFLAMSLIDKL